MSADTIARLKITLDDVSPVASVSGNAMVDARRRGVASMIVWTLTVAAIRGQQPTDC
jgi:hypothetical protein